MTCSKGSNSFFHSLLSSRITIMRMPVLRNLMKIDIKCLRMKYILMTGLFQGKVQGASSGTIERKGRDSEVSIIHRVGRIRCINLWIFRRCSDESRLRRCRINQYLAMTTVRSLTCFLYKTASALMVNPNQYSNTTN